MRASIPELFLSIVVVRNGGVTFKYEFTKPDIDRVRMIAPVPVEVARC